MRSLWLRVLVCVGLTGIFLGDAAPARAVTVIPVGTLGGPHQLNNAQFEVIP